jgi:hypothetical protein
MEACSDFEAHRIRVSGPPTSIQYISVRGWTAIRVRPSPEREKKHKTKEASAGRPMESQQVAPQTAARAVAREGIPMHPPATAPRFEPGCRRARYGPHGPGRKRRKDACSARTEAWRASRRRRDGWMDGDRARKRRRVDTSQRPGPISQSPQSHAFLAHPSARHS